MRNKRQITYDFDDDSASDGECPRDADQQYTDQYGQFLYRRQKLPIKNVTIASGDATVIEGESATYTVSTSLLTYTGLELEHQLSDDASTGDFITHTQTVVIKAGETSATFTVDAVDFYSDNGEKIPSEYQQSRRRISLRYRYDYRAYRKRRYLNLRRCCGARRRRRTCRYRHRNSSSVSKRPSTTCFWHKNMSKVGKPSAILSLGYKTV